MMALINNGLPRINRLKLRQVLSRYNRKKDTMIGDKGLFSQTYLRLFRQGIGQDILCAPYEWSSGNHHYARVLACFGLLEYMNQLGLGQGARVLLVGHSHAGQLFALLTHMIADRGFAEELAHVTEVLQHGLNRRYLHEQLRRLCRLKLDFATLGTPRRYQWHLSSRQQVVHLINHRGEDLLGRLYEGALTTRFGDYVQQWGIEGSDSLSPIAKHNRINQVLSEYLGPGFQPSLWRKEVVTRSRVHASGHNILIDYKDNSSRVNCLASIFGHGIYTRYGVMMYNTKVITNHLYPRKLRSHFGLLSPRK